MEILSVFPGIESGEYQWSQQLAYGEESDIKLLEKKLRGDLRLENISKEVLKMVMAIGSVAIGYGLVWEKPLVGFIGFFAITWSNSHKGDILNAISVNKERLQLIHTTLKSRNN